MASRTAAARGGVTATESAGWGHGAVTDPALASPPAKTDTVAAEPAPAAALQWVWREQHELPRWGRQSEDIASIGLPDTLTYDTLVTPSLLCVSCGKGDSVRLLKHHPGGCGAFEWSHGIDIDWRWTCCGKHENLCHEVECSPAGSHPKTGCVEAPICTACFRCPCAGCIAARQRDLAELYGD